jgi:hypothetical protein
MPQVTTLVLKDQSAVDHSFAPKSISGGVATLVNSTGVPIGDKTVSYSVKQTTTGRYKVLVKLAVPIVQDITVNGVSKPTAVRTSYVDMQFTFDDTSSTLERYDVLAYARNLLLNEPQMLAVIGDLSAPF